MRFKQWIESQEEQEIRGEYWIQNGNVDFADGDVGDKNHEAIATEYVFNKYADGIIELSNELGIDAKSALRYGEYDQEELHNLFGKIIEHLEEKEDRYDNSLDAYLMKKLKCNKEALHVLKNNDGGQDYVMWYEGWIAVRGNNAELYGYDNNKRKSLMEGIKEIFYQEYGKEPSPDTEFSVFDHKNGKHSNYTLAQLENASMRPKQIATTKAKAILPITKDSGENKYSKPVKSTEPTLWDAAARNAGITAPGQQMWRGTSESHYNKI